jgi:hypothetical protein
MLSAPQMASMRIPWHCAALEHAPFFEKLRGQSFASLQQIPAPQQNPFLQWLLWQSRDSLQRSPSSRVP